MPLRCLPDRVEVPPNKPWAGANSWIDVPPGILSDCPDYHDITQEYTIEDLCVDYAPSDSHPPPPLQPSPPITLPDPARSVNKYIQLMRDRVLDTDLCLCESTLSKGIYCIHNSLFDNGVSKIDLPVGAYGH